MMTAGTLSSTDERFIDASGGGHRRRRRVFNHWWRSARVVSVLIGMTSVASADVITTIAGGIGVGRGAWRRPVDIAAHDGKLYSIDREGVLRAYDPIALTESVVFCNGTPGASCAAPAPDAVVPGDPRRIASAPDGTLYLLGARLWALPPGGQSFEIAAGAGTEGCAGNGGLAVDASFSYPWALAIDRVGNVFVADIGPGCGGVFRIDAVSRKMTKVRTGGYYALAAIAPDELVAVTGTAAEESVVRILPGPDGFVEEPFDVPGIEVNSLSALTFDAGTGTLFVGDGFVGNRPTHVRGFDAGTGAPRSIVATVDATAPPIRMAALPGRLYIQIGDLIFEAADGNLVLVLGDPAPVAGGSRPALGANLRWPESVAVDPEGRAYVADTGNHVVRRIDGGIIETVVGTGTPPPFGEVPGPGPPRQTPLRYPLDVTVTGDGTLYVSEGHRLLEVDLAQNQLSPIAVMPTPTGTIVMPHGIAAAPDGGIYVADDVTDVVVKLVRSTAGYHQEVVAGRWLESGYEGDGGPATAAKLRDPGDVAVGPDGAVYIADTGNGAIRRVQNGRIETIIGPGRGWLDGGPWAGACDFVTVSADGVVFFSSRGPNRVYRVDGAEVFPVAGTGFGGFGGDGGPPLNAYLKLPQGLAFASDGALLIADSENNRIRRVELSAVCGNGRVDPGEACDPAYPAVGRLDCCRSDCQFEAPRRVCWAGHRVCSSISRCTGRSAVCPFNLTSCLGRLGRRGVSEDELLPLELDVRRPR